MANTKSGAEKSGNAAGQAAGRNSGEARYPIESAPEVTRECRHRLAECCAFFQAEKYREADPGTIRSSDVEKAEAEIDGLIEKYWSADH